MGDGNASSVRVDVKKEEYSVHTICMINVRTKEHTSKDGQEYLNDDDVQRVIR